MNDRREADPYRQRLSHRVVRRVEAAVRITVAAPRDLFDAGTVGAMLATEGA